ncbi:MAG: mechanosensitive ion channel [Arenibacter sp.]|nr:mechanosensitive ion channel [Muriicola sp.]NNE02000.1 mechanosensitive ion channel [Eudoraea sp.]NNG09581.1 mechanosensitive ion channel [Arenibacter sp.]
METIGSLATESLTSIIQDIVSALPGIIGAIIVLLLAWIIIKITSFVLRKILRIARIDKVSEKINNAKLFGENSTVKVDVSKILLGFLKGILWITFIIVAAEIMGLTAISSEISNLLHYLPILLSAVVIFMIGMFAAKLVRKALLGIFDSMGVGGSKIVSGIVYYLIIVFVLITALNQAGINTEIITSNITLIIGAFLLAFAIGLGLGSREIVADLLTTFYARKTYAIGDAIKTKKIEGTIEAIDGISVTVKTKTARLVIPIKDLVQNKVEIQ